MQAFYFELGLVDIPWNFLIGDDGAVYEGRGFKYQGEIPMNDAVSSFDDIGLHVAFIGNFINEPPSVRQINTFQLFLDDALRQEVLKENYILLLEDQLSMTESPAAGLLEALTENSKFYSSMKFKPEYP